MKKSLLIAALAFTVSFSASAQKGKHKDRLANVELSPEQRASIDSVKKVYNQKKMALKKDATVSDEARTEKMKALKKEQNSTISTFLTASQKKQIKQKNKGEAKKEGNS